MLFADRTTAGKQLADRLADLKNQPGTIVFGLPRGGVPVAYEIAKALNLAMDVFIVRKLGVPRHAELAMGAIALGGICILNQDVIDMLNISDAEIEEVKQRELQELNRRNQLYRGNKVFPDLTHKTIILVDDGIATGATMRAGIAALRQLSPLKIIVAAPVAAEDTCRKIAREADELVVLETPEPFQSIGLWYQDFAQTTDEEVIRLLNAKSNH